MSGGHRQHLGIARFLYKQATVLVLDEATSALDDATENELMRNVDALGRDITLIMIAHRPSRLGDCDLLLRIEAGCVVTGRPPAEQDFRYAERTKYESQ